VELWVFNYHIYLTVKIHNPLQYKDNIYIVSCFCREQRNWGGGHKCLNYRLLKMCCAQRYENVREALRALQNCNTPSAFQSQTCCHIVLIWNVHFSFRLTKSSYVYTHNDIFGRNSVTAATTDFRDGSSMITLYHAKKKINWTAGELFNVNT
jgi:hypothetical protein